MKWLGGGGKKVSWGRKRKKLYEEGKKETGKTPLRTCSSRSPGSASQMRWISMRRDSSSLRVASNSWARAFSCVCSN